MTTILVDPSAEDANATRTGAARIADLRGKRIGLLDNIKHNAEYLLDEVGERLAKDYGCEIIRVRKKTYTKFAEPQVLAQLEGCHGVVTAIGD